MSDADASGEQTVIRTEFDLSTTLLAAIHQEGAYDYLDDAPTSTNPLSPFSSPLSSLPSSCLSSPLSSPPSSRPPSPFLESQTLTPSPSNPKKRKRKTERDKQVSKQNRKNKRARTLPKTAEDIPARPSGKNKHVQDAQPIPTAFCVADDAPVASTAYIGLRDEGGEGIDADGAYWLSKVVGPKSRFNFNLIRYKPGASVPFVDTEGRLVALVVDPGAKDWDKCIHAATKAFEHYRPHCRFTEKQESHRRGVFPALSTGISYGGGQMQPGNLIHNKKNAQVLHKLTNHWAFQRMSGFATGVFKSWAPRLFNYYSDHVSKLLDSDEALVQPFDNSVLSAAAFNFGPVTVCYPHIDYANLPFGLCFIWALGNYDYTKGGHLILWDLKVVIEFPPGVLAAILSGVCRHSNTRIRKGEKRYSFTQFSAGGLFRWVDYGFQTMAKFFATISQRDRHDEEVRKKARWELGLNLLPTLKDLGLHL